MDSSLSSTNGTTSRSQGPVGGGQFLSRDGGLELGRGVQVVPTAEVGRAGVLLEVKVVIGCGALFCLFGGLMGLMNYFETTGSPFMYIVSGLIMLIGLCVCMVGAVVLGLNALGRVETVSA